MITTVIVASPMALTRCLPILLLVAMTATTGASEDRANFYVTKCYPPLTPTADGGSAFRGNFLYLLEALPSAAAPTGFASSRTAGRAVSDRALVRGLCVGDSPPKPCRRCLSDAGFLDERCFLGYADGANSSSAGADEDFRAAFFSGDAVPSPDIVSVQRLVALAHSLSPRATDGSVATAKATTPASKGGATTVNRAVHVLAQCARDQPAADCVVTVCVAVMIGMVVGALIVDVRDRHTIKARRNNNRNAAAAAPGGCRAPFAAMLALLVLARPEGTSAYGFTTHYFPQELDHFSFTPASSIVFYQRYLVNDSFWARSHVDDGKVAGPIFVYTGNEGSVQLFVANTGFMFDIAPKFGALLVFIEHRFYGESKPFGNHSYDSTEKLGYLTSTQALADYAILISSLKQNLSAVDSPVVVFGGSYGGMLAAWFRLKYPHVAIGALASSAPILMFDHITPWTSFYDALSQDYKSESLNCFSVIKAVWDVLYVRASSKAGLLELSQTFRACQTVPSVDFFVRWLEDAFKFTSLFDHPVPVYFVKNLPAYPIKEMCKIIDSFSAGTDVVHKAFAAASLYYNYTGTERCFQIEKAGDPLGPVFQWQACTEIILPMTSSKYSIFPPSEFSYHNRSADCLRTFKVLPRPHWVTTEYGGNKIEHVLKHFGSNIIFSNGLRDPLSRGGVLKNISSNIIALVAEKGAHHFDLRGATKDDPDWVVEQRRQEVEIIQGWINQYYDDTA